MSKALDIRPNFESINYALRPGKCIERKMLCEAFSRLSIIDSLKNYQYIGFGSAYFTDFQLFHKSLGIRKMLSIENEIDFKARIEFNKPFSCIDVKYGESSEVLATLDEEIWINKCIVWLDYTEKLMEYMLGDIRTVVANIKNGSILLVSVNITQDQYNPSCNEKPKDWRQSQLEKRINKKNIPNMFREVNLDTKTNKKVVREIIDNTIKNALMVRNGGNKPEDHLIYTQLFNIHYKDGASMLTVGGIFTVQSEKKILDKLHLNNLGFIVSDDNTYDISVPNLTFREIHALDKFLPNETGYNIDLPISKDDIENYSKIYRYFPTFAEANL